MQVACRAADAGHDLHYHFVWHLLLGVVGLTDLIEGATGHENTTFSLLIG